MMTSTPGNRLAKQENCSHCTTKLDRKRSDGASMFIPAASTNKPILPWSLQVGFCSVLQSLGNSQREYEKHVLLYSICNQLRFRNNLGEHFRPPHRCRTQMHQESHYSTGEIDSHGEMFKNDSSFMLHLIKVKVGFVFFWCSKISLCPFSLN